ncbi:MAG: zinc-finger domain-containing protein [Candidatus Puniceispirillum sp.]|uniref:zinc-finger domain-containing protein n=1 Tax=Candidatus Puniceispirillum sp. TaxID=2026719 RepID=UPI001ED6EB25|nr:zinc-finger domain-containing protein [Candidatus Puniceispirillum sp.]MBT6415108.1 zinc-finger domain-containing protein [Candidatus Puniceispirillum sp.]MBT6565791.1 zinc-finger domain-containing protein [Candidatus Puniceispirillum sp.]
MAVIPTSQQRVSCNGGGGALGHPLVWLTLGTDDKVVCPYCSRTYVKATSDNS